MRGRKGGVALLSVLFRPPPPSPLTSPPFSFLSSPVQAEVFEEVPTMDFPFHGMPTVPPRKDMGHMVRREGEGRAKTEGEKKEEREEGCEGGG